MSSGLKRLPYSDRMPHGPRGRGFTLLELLVVIALLGVLMGLAAGGYLSLNRGLDLTGYESRVETVVRSARNSTLYESAPAGVFISEVGTLELRDPVEYLDGEIVEENDKRVVFLPDGQSNAVEIERYRVVRNTTSRRIRAIGFQTVGLWHFEKDDSTSGFLGRPCQLDGATTVLGKIGYSALLNEEAGGRARIVCPPAPDDAEDPFILPRGGRIGMWVKELRGAGAAYLIRYEGAYELKIDADGILEGGPVGHMVRFEDYTLPLDRWVYLVFMFGPGWAELHADGVRRGAGDTGPLSIPRKGELVIGQGFVGLVDEVRVQKRVVGDDVEIPEDYEVQGPAAVFFDERGRLDAREHPRPVTVKVIKDGKEAGFTVSRNGLIDTF